MYDDKQHDYHLKDYMEVDIMTTKKIFKLWVANELINRGFEVVGWEVNINNPRLKVFLFENTTEFKKALKEVTVK